MPRKKLYTEEELAIRHRESARKWSQRNAQQRREKMSEYYAKNKEAINARRALARRRKKMSVDANHIK